MVQKEIVQIHVGQAGVQIGSACWELFNLEHAVQPNGMLAHEYIKPMSINAESVNNIETFYHMTDSSREARCQPRCVMVDLEPSVIDEIRTGTYRQLFRPESLLTGKEDAASNFARGMYTVGKEMLDAALDSIRRTTDECENLQGFIIYRSYGGGTGSGFTTILSERLHNEFDKCTIMEYGIYPSPCLSPVIVEPYNTVFSAHGALEYQDISFLLDNQAAYNILGRKLEVKEPTYSNVNTLLAQVVSNKTASLRYEGGLNVSLREMNTNLVPYPRLHFPLITYAPFIPVSQSFYEEGSILSLTNSCFEPANQLIVCNPWQGKFLSCCMLYRGNVQPTDVNTAIYNVKNQKKNWFVGWCPTGFKVSINYLPPTCLPGGDLANVQRSVVMLSNTTAIKTSWQDVAEKFRIMYQTRAFVHHYVAEGMEEAEFVDALEDIEADRKSVV